MRAILGAVIAFGAALAGQSLKPVPNPVPPGRGVIAGRVIDAVSRRPIADVTVTLTPKGEYARWTPGLTTDPATTIITNATGSFRFENLGPIEYDLSAWRTGYGEGGPGKTWARGSRAPLKLEQDQRLTDLEVPLWPDAELIGRVLDERGMPMAGVSVGAFAESFNEGTRRFGDYISQVVTGQEGEYRFTVQPVSRITVCVRPSYSTYTIPPLQHRASGAAGAPGWPFGTSLLITPDGRSVTIAQPLPPPSAPDGHRLAYVQTCAPAAPSMEGATILDLKGGRTTAPDLVMQVRPSIQVSGRLLGPAGPLGETWLRLVSTTEPAATMFISSALTSADGTFRLDVVPSGEYRWRVYVPNPPPRVTASGSGFPSFYHPDYSYGPGPGYWVPDIFAAGSSDMADMTVTARRGVTVRGSIEFDARPAGERPTRVSLATAADRIGARSAPVDTAGDFEITDVIPGRYAFSVSSGETIVEARHQGVDLLDHGLEVDDRGVTGVVIRTSTTAATLTGVVRDARATVMDHATVVIFPVRSDAWEAPGAPPPRIRSVRAIAGRYTFDRLPPGDYHVTAIDDALMARWRDSALLSTLAVSASRVALQVGERRVLDLLKR